LDPFLVNSQSRICLFYGTFSISHAAGDPFLGQFLTVHSPVLFRTFGTRLVLRVVFGPRSILYPSGVTDARLPAFENPQSAQTRKMGSGYHRLEVHFGPDCPVLARRMTVFRSHISMLYPIRGLVIGSRGESISYLAGAIYQPAAVHVKHLAKGSRPR
jgi:hypothetical protein